MNYALCPPRGKQLAMLWAASPLLLACSVCAPPPKLLYLTTIKYSLKGICGYSAAPGNVTFGRLSETPGFLLHKLSLQQLPKIHLPSQISGISASFSAQGSHLSNLLLVLACCLGFFLHSQPALAETLPESPPVKISVFVDPKLQLLPEDFAALEQPILDLGPDAYRISSTSSISQNESRLPFLDYAGVLNAAKADSLLNDIHRLEDELGWRVRVVTRSVSSPSVSGKELKDLWKPDDKTVIVIEDLSSPNILNFNTGSSVSAKLPRQFFIELQSRFGNQFFVQQEGEGVALLSTVHAIEECLRKPDGCRNVPGLTDDLYYLTLATSIVGGCVFGFAARLPPSGRVEASWQWLLILSPLWLLLFASFGVLPVIGRTTDLEPLLKNTLGFAGGAVAFYLTPIFGPSPISKQ